MNECPEHSRLMAYMDGELPDPEASAVRSHVESCVACRRFVDTQALIERSYRDSFEAPAEESFRLMERRIMATVKAPPRKRLPAFVPIAAALLIAVAGVRLAGRAGLLERPSPEIVTVTPARDRVEPPADIPGEQPGGVFEESAAPDAVAEQPGQTDSDAGDLQEQMAIIGTAQTDEGPPATAALEDEGAPGCVGGSTGLTAGAGGGAGGQYQTEAAGCLGAVSQTSASSIDDGYLSFDAAAGRACDSDQATSDTASGESALGNTSGAEGDWIGSTVDVLTRDLASADRTLATCEAVQEAQSPCPYGAAGLSSVLILFDTAGVPASPDSVLLDSYCPGWKDSLAGCMVDTALVVTCDEFSELVEAQGEY